MSLLVVLAACSLPGTTSSPTLDSPPEGDSATLVRVDDGDSFVAIVDGEEQRIRMIGINAPEQGECVADLARQRLIALLTDTELMLVADVDPTDRFDRSLRYVYVGSELINETLAAEGLVLARPFEPNTSLQDLLERAEQNARDERLGIWDPEACGLVETSVEIVHIEEDPPGRDLEGEYIEIANEGPDVDLTGWSIRDETSQNRYEFPPGTTLETQGRLRVYTGCGTDTEFELHWCSATPVWDNSGDTAFLITDSGAIQASSSYGQ